MATLDLPSEALDCARAIFDSLPWRARSGDGGMSSSLQVGPIAESVTLASGSLGCQLFQAAFLSLTDPASEKAFREECLHAIATHCATVEVGAGLLTGLAGLAWAFRYHAGRLGVEESQVDRWLCDVDSMLREAVACSNEASYDMVSGTVGIGIYAASYAARPACQGLLGEAALKICELVTQQDRLAYIVTPAAAVVDRADLCAPYGLVDLGMAHGLPGAVVLLSRALTLGAVASEWSATLGSLSDTLIACAVPDGDSLRLPARAICDSKGRPMPSVGRPLPSWCYGGLGAAIAIYAAARCTNAANACRVARQLAFADSSPEELWSMGWNESSVCHGLAGASLVHWYLGITENSERHTVLAQAWQSALLRARVAQDEPESNVGFMTYGTEDGVNYLPTRSNGLLVGSAGIGLALLTVSGRYPSTWCQVLGML